MSAPDRTPDPRERRLDLYPRRAGGWGLDLDGHGGAVDPAIARWRDDREHLTREALAAYERGDLGSADQALEHLDVLDDEQHRDTRTTPMQPLSEAETAALDELENEEIEEPEP